MLNRHGLIVLSLVLLSTAWAGADPQSGAPRPNIVLMTADNLGYHDTRCYGNDRVITPNIDRLAAQGVRCTNFYSASPTCTVSRAAYLTGRYPQRNGLTHQLRTNLDEGIDENMGVGLRHSEKLLPEYLKPLGYSTACFGKWNIGFGPGSRPTERGFDEYLGNASGNCDYYTHVYAGRNDFFRGTEPVPEMKGYSTFLLADAACDFVRRNAKRPFFLYVPFNAVHYPGARNKAPGVECIWQAPDEAFRAYGWSPDTRDVEKRYYATVTALDMGIGRVLDQLDRLSLADNTLVIFFSDNGAFKAQMEYASNHPFRTERRMIYEGSIRVASAVRWPGRIRPGTVCDELLVSMDFVPMILKAAGAPLPDDRVIDGRDPTATLAGAAPSPHKILFWQYAGCDAARQGKTKIIRTSPKKPFELYDLEADPGETNDLAADKPEVVEELKRKFDAWATAVREDAESK